MCGFCNVCVCVCVYSEALSQKKTVFRSDGFLNKMLMGYFGIRGGDDIKVGGKNYVMRSPFKFALRLI